MAAMSFHGMDITVRGYIERAIGQVCCRQHIGKDGSLSLGFGEVIRLKTAIAEADHGTWEVGTYYRSWRVVHGRRILCGSQDQVDDINEFRRVIRAIEWGRLSDIRQHNGIDVRIEFNTGVFVDILSTISDYDEVFHMFLPENIVVAFSVVKGWKAGPSDKPWKE